VNVLAAVAGLLLALAAIFMIRMVRRDEPMQGLIGLILGLIAAIPAAIYAGLNAV
jgi:hypothetical protein